MVRRAPLAILLAVPSHHAVEVPSGIHRIRALSTPEKVIDGVRMVVQQVRLTVALSEGAP